MKLNIHASFCSIKTPGQALSIFIRASREPKERISYGYKECEVINQLVSKCLLSLVVSGLDWEGGGFCPQGFFNFSVFIVKNDLLRGSKFGRKN